MPHLLDESTVAGISSFPWRILSFQRDLKLPMGEDTPPFFFRPSTTFDYNSFKPEGQASSVPCLCSGRSRSTLASILATTLSFASPTTHRGPSG